MENYIVRERRVLSICQSPGSDKVPDDRNIFSNRPPLLSSPLKSPADLDIPKGLQPLLTALSSHCPRKGVSGLMSKRPCSKPLAVMTLLSPRLLCSGLYPLPTLFLFSMLFVWIVSVAVASTSTLEPLSLSYGGQPWLDLGIRMICTGILFHPPSDIPGPFSSCCLFSSSQQTLVTCVWQASSVATEDTEVLFYLNLQGFYFYFYYPANCCNAWSLSRQLLFTFYPCTLPKIIQ